MPGCPHQAAHLSVPVPVLCDFTKIKDTPFRAVVRALHDPANPCVATPPPVTPAPQTQPLAPLIYSKFSERAKCALFPGCTQARAHALFPMPLHPSHLRLAPPPVDKLPCSDKAWLGASPLWFLNPLRFPDHRVPGGDVALLRASSLDLEGRGCVFFSVASSELDTVLETSRELGNAC